jgi:hypothetical protein
MKNVCIVGTVHSATEHYTSNSLVAIFKFITPDLILEELTGEFYNEDWQRRRSYDGMEDIAIDRYVAERPTERNRYWDLRNYTMANNIVARLKNVSESGNVVVLCGFKHRYALRSGLRDIAADSDIALREYWEDGKSIPTVA